MKYLLSINERKAHPGIYGININDPSTHTGERDRTQGER